jgi:phosphohistidine swiveling domain-containing protein
MGYQKISSSRLMVEFGGKPYIDMRCVFNALCLDSFPETLKHKLVAFYMDKLETFPQLHDEVEFSVLFSAYDFDFDERAEELRGILNYHEIRLLKECLLEFTENIIENYSQWLTDDSADMLYFDKARTELSAVDCSSIQVKACFLDHLLSSIKKYGTGQFSRAARLAFIAKSLLKSLERKEFLTAEQYNAILRSIGTVTSDFTHDISRYAKGEISIAELRRLYGHLRPGSYNILNERYDISPVYLTGFEQNMREGELRFSLPFETRNRIDGYLEEEGIKMRCESILQFVVDATQARERFKFEFTKFLSDALEVIAVIGRDLGLSKHEVALLDIETLLSLKNESESKESGARKIRALISDRIWERTRDKLLRLPPLLKNRLDFEFFYHMDSKPNFITHKSVVGDAIYLEDGVLDLSDKIVLIEFADPGFDWIFTRQIRGLITKYGGPASHMGIRCAELGIPAALGCGRLFDKLRHQKKLSLDCRTEALFSMQCF